MKIRHIITEGRRVNGNYHRLEDIIARLGIPNLTVGEFMHDFVAKAHQDVHGVDPQIFDIANGMTDFAETGDVALCEEV